MKLQIGRSHDMFVLIIIDVETCINADTLVLHSIIFQSCLENTSKGRNVSLLLPVKFCTTVALHCQIYVSRSTNRQFAIVHIPYNDIQIQIL